MSSKASQIVRLIVADYFHVEPHLVRISGYIGVLPTYKEWYAYTANGFIEVVPFVTTYNLYFLVSVHKGVYTVHTIKNNKNEQTQSKNIPISISYQG